MRDQARRREATPQQRREKPAPPPETPGRRRSRSRSTSENLPRRQRGESLGKKPSLRLDLSPSTGNRGREHEIPTTENGRHARRTLNSHREKQDRNKTSESSSAQMKSDRKNLEPSHGTGRNRSPERQAIDGDCVVLGEKNGGKSPTRATHAPDFLVFLNPTCYFCYIRYSKFLHRHTYM
ncbi:predicted protein [Arabidopsis lyrata subsp. lyrata]|uniref:Predicted protein n=1 Tax=Arabidopsis lyrata subsp. lyrata TaxID=81972 RepID=D7KNF7_ARALL|nr:predicted protein [Arabidopsis lyrata subsp. lyrata]